VTEFTVVLHISAPAERCFDLSRSIDLHLHSMDTSKEKVIAGVTSGLISLGETVTWRARHFGVWQNLTSKITDFDTPHQFVDEMQKGAFKSFWHQHRFETSPEGTIMTDTIRYEVPHGAIGKLFDRWVLKSYMVRLIEQRNEVIRQVAECNQWEKYLS